MCYKKPLCPRYIENKRNKNYNACKDCEYLKQLKKLHTTCKIGLVIAAGIFISMTYAYF